MGNWLKQSTSVIIQLGPFVDETDGQTPETALTITQPDIQLSKNGGAFAQCSAVATLVHDADGWYPKTLSTTDTNTLGELIVQVNEAGALPVWREFMVVPANVWDSFFGADLLQVDDTQLLGSAWATPATAGLPDVNVKQISTDVTAADNAELFFDGTGYGGGTTKLQVDTVALSGDTVAADNAELMFDGTGYTGGTAKLVVTLNNTQGIKKNTALANFEFVMYDASGDPKTGETVTPERSIDGAAFAACANAVVEVASGAYKILLAATDLNGDVITLKFTSAGAKTQMVTIVTVQA